MEPVNACIDQPSSKDYGYPALFGAVSGTPESSLYALSVIQDQSAEAVTAMACTRFSLAHIVNAQNEYRASHTDGAYVLLEAKPIWVDYLKINAAAASEGATLQSSLEQFRKLGLITGYSVANEIDEMKDSISHGRLISTGSINGNWNDVSDNKAYSLRNDGRKVGHAFCIIGYDASGWIAVNSYGQNNGLFTIPYDLTNTLFTRYSVVDDNDEEFIRTYHQRVMASINIEEAKKAFEAGIWNGERSTETVSREECAAMVYRATHEKSPT